MARIMLAIEDDEMRSYLADKLKRAGHCVTRVAEFPSALTILEEAAYDMLLTSIDAANPDQVEFARMAQEIDRDMRLMFITGFSVIAVKRPEEATGRSSELDQPVHLIRLPQEVDRFLAA